MKKIIILLVAVLIIVIVVVTEKISQSSNEWNEGTEEKYMSILLNNKEDFDYVAETIKQWPSGYIDFGVSYSNNNLEIVIDNCFATNNPEMANEILNNEELYYHLLKIYNLGEISTVFCSESYDEYVVTFYFCKYPIGFHGGLCYREQKKIYSTITQNDEHWELQLIPDI